MMHGPERTVNRISLGGSAEIGDTEETLLIIIESEKDEKLK